MVSAWFVTHMADNEALQAERVVIFDTSTAKNRLVHWHGRMRVRRVVALSRHGP